MKLGPCVTTNQHIPNVYCRNIIACLCGLLQEYASELLDNVLTSAVKEKQSSVRHLMVWVAIRVLLCHPNLQEMVWDQVHQVNIQTKTIIKVTVVRWLDCRTCNHKVVGSNPPANR